MGDPRLIVIVLNNRDLNRVTWEMRVMEGDPKYEASQDLPDFPYAEYAELIGLKGIKVDQPETRGCLGFGFSADRPVVLEACTDPDVPPIPPHIKREQARAYASAIMRGDSDSADIIRATVSKFLPDRQRVRGSLHTPGFARIIDPFGTKAVIDANCARLLPREPAA